MQPEFEASEPKTKREVIMPTLEEVAAMEREGDRLQRKSGRREMFIGLVVIITSLAELIAEQNRIPDDANSDQNSWLLSWTIRVMFIGIVVFFIGFSRQFKSKRRY